MALCEQVHTVDIQRLGTYCGVCSEQEMQGIDIALMVSLGLQPASQQPEAAGAVKPLPASASESDPSLDEILHELIAAKAQLGIVRQMYDDLLKQCISAKMM
jgi:hypothetical protein